MRKLILIPLILFYSFCFGAEYKYKPSRVCPGGPELIASYDELIFNETAYLGDIILKETATEVVGTQYIGVDVSLIYCGADAQNLYFQRTEHYGTFIESQANIVYKISNELKMTIRMLKIPFELKIIELG